jgi:hypothetical protein
MNMHHNQSKKTAAPPLRTYSSGVDTDVDNGCGSSSTLLALPWGSPRSEYCLNGVSTVGGQDHLTAT